PRESPRGGLGGHTVGGSIVPGLPEGRGVAGRAHVAGHALGQAPNGPSCGLHPNPFHAAGAGSLYRYEGPAPPRPDPCGWRGRLAPQEMTPPLAEGAAAFFEDCMDRIRSSRPVVLDFSTCVLDVDGELIRLEFSSAELEAKISRALAHLRVLPAGPEGLCLHIWDAAVSCVPMPPSPWSGASYRSQAGTFKAEEGRVVYQDDRFLMHFYLSEHMLLLDFATNTGLVCYPDAGGLAGYDRAAPLRSAMQCWLDRRG